MNWLEGGINMMPNVELLHYSEHSKVEREGNPAELCPRVDRAGAAEKGPQSGSGDVGGSAAGGGAADATTVTVGGDDAELDGGGRSEPDLRGRRDHEQGRVHQYSHCPFSWSYIARSSSIAVFAPWCRSLSGRHLLSLLSVRVSLMHEGNF